LNFANGNTNVLLNNKGIPGKEKIYDQDEHRDRKSLKIPKRLS